VQREAVFEIEESRLGTELREAKVIFLKECGRLGLLLGLFIVTLVLELVLNRQAKFSVFVIALVLGPFGEQVSGT